MIRILRNKIVTYIITVAIILSSIFQNVVFARTNDKEIFSDINGHWAEDTIIKHAKKGMLKGYPDGTFKPDQGMKRCELISVINRYFGLKNKSNDNYNDINEKAWYAEDTAKAKYYHYVQGLTVEPNKEATRDDVIGMLALILDMEEQAKTNESITYSDIENLEEENRNNINEFSKMGYVQGYTDGEFKPNKVINRAEILAITEAVLGYIITSQEDLKNIPKDAKKISIITPNITIENLETEVDIYISAGVNGKLTIKDSKLKGKVEIAGGTKKNPIQLENVEVGKLIITKAKEKPTINMISTNVKEVKVKSEATINTDKRSVIKKADIRSKSNWTGQGKIQKAYVKTKDVTIEKKPQYVEVIDKKISVTIGKKDITYKTDDKRPYSSGSSSSSQQLTKTNITKVDITGQTKQGETLTANISPIGATVSYKWQREEVTGTYEDIVGATVSTYTLTADDVDKNIRVVATGKGNYKGETISQPVGVILSNDPIAIKIKDGWIPIASKEELQQINSNTDKTFGVGTKYEDTYTGGMGKKYMLIADIDLTGENFVPIGYNSGTPIEFVGQFTGEGYTISNLIIDRDEEYQGFFSKLGQGAEITHVNIDTVEMKTSSKSGVLAGESNGAKIADSQIKHVTYDLYPGIVVADMYDFDTNKKSAIGGYVGDSTSTVFENLLVEDFNMEPCSYNNRNSLAEGIGGLAGMVNGGTVKGCTVKDITLRAEFMPDVDQAYSFMLAGGLIGQLNNSFTDLLEIVDNNVENINMKINGIQLASGGRENSGGLIGEINNSSSGISINGDIRISDCQVTGEIQGGDRFTGTSCVGGLIGTVDGTGTPLGKIEISNSNTSVRMYDFLKDPGYLDIALQKCGVGGFAGRLKNVNIDNCYAIGDVGKFGDWNPNTNNGNKIDGFAPLGGFAGCIEDSYIEDSYATGDICGAMQSGGFASITINSDINRCYATGNLESKTGIWIGGFIAWVRGGVSIQDSYAIGNINNCDMECGNFIGLVSGGLELRDVYGAGKVTIKNGSDGAFIGNSEIEPNIANSFYNKTGNETLVPIGYKVNTSLKAKTTDELKQILTFTDWDISEVGSGQNTVWLIEEGVTYPYLNDSYIPVISTECDVTAWNTPSNPTIGNKVGTDIRKTVDYETSEMIIDVAVSSGATWKLYSDSGCSSEIGNKKLILSEGTNTEYLKVTAEDGSTNKVYILTITRESAKLEITKVDITGQTKQGETLTANISPIGATVTYKWQREEVAGTYVAGATASTYTLTADDVDKNIRVVAIGTGSYKGETTSQPVGVILTNDTIAIKIKDGWIPIANKEELQQINSNTDKTFGLGTKYEDTYTGGMGKKYMLIADIDLTGENFEPIGYNSGTPIEFVGQFTGEGYTISNLIIDRDEEYQGLFSKLGQGAEITHVNIDTVEMKTSSKSGVLAGESNGARITDSEIKHVDYNLFPVKFHGEWKSAIGGYVGASTSTVFENLKVEDFQLVLDEDSIEIWAKNLGGLSGIVDGGTVKGCTIKDITLRAEDDITKNNYSFRLMGGLIGQLNNSTSELLEIVDNKVENLDMKISGWAIGDNSGGLIGEINNSKESKVPTNGDIRISGCQVKGSIQGGGGVRTSYGTTLAGGLIGIVDGTGTPMGKIEISNSNTSVRMYDFLKSPGYLDTAIAQDGVGGFAGRLKNVKVYNCYATGDMGKFGDFDPDSGSGVKIDEDAVMAGFVGWIQDSIVEDSYATGDIYGSTYSAGFASATMNSKISRCYATGDINSKISTTSWIGGFIGWTIAGNHIQDSYAISNVKSGHESGNFIGFESGTTKLHNVYGAGKVTIKDGNKKSAFIGNCIGNPNIINAFYNITGNETLVPIGGSVNDSLKAKTTDELKQIATFTGWDISEAGSGQNTIWLIEEGITYPYLNDSYMPVISTKCNVTSWNTPSNPTIGNKVGTDIRKTVDNETSEMIIDVAVSSGATWNLYSDSNCSSEIENKSLLYLWEITQLILK